MFPVHENLEGKVAVITGGSGVLCSAMAKELGRQKVKVAILNRTLENGQKVADEINKANGEAIAIGANVLEEDALLEAKQEVLSKFGKIDILINGAGGNHEDAITSEEKHSQDAKKSFFDLKDEGFTSVFDRNFKGSFLAAKVFGEALLEQQGSSIINISSMSAYAPMTKVPAYSAAKAAINNFTMWLSVHFANTGLRVNAIAPGFFLTTQNRDLLLDKEGNHTARAEKIITGTPMEKFGDPNDLIGTLLWLVDPEYSGFVTGVTIPVDGGFMAYSGV